MSSPNDEFQRLREIAKRAFGSIVSSHRSQKYMYTDDERRLGWAAAADFQTTSPPLFYPPGGGTFTLRFPDIDLQFSPTYQPELEQTVIESLDSRRLLAFAEAIRGCPLLEELNINIKCLEDDDKDGELEIVNFSSPLIKKLVVQFWGGERTILVEPNILESLEYYVSSHNGEHQIIINTPNLKYLSYYAPALGASFNQYMNSLVGARIGVGWHDDHQLTSHDAIDHLIGVQRVTSLSLGEHILEGDFLPTFENFTSLELQPAGHSGEMDHVLSWTMLHCIFEKDPKLEVLIFSKVVLDNIGENEESDYLFLEALPTCFIKHLKEIETKHFNKKQYEFKLVENLLQNGIALKKTVVGLFLVASVCRRLMSLKRLSRDCQIVLDELKTHCSSIPDDL